MSALKNTKPTITTSQTYIFLTNLPHHATDDAVLSEVFFAPIFAIGRIVSSSVRKRPERLAGMRDMKKALKRALKKV